MAAAAEESPVAGIVRAKLARMLPTLDLSAETQRTIQKRLEDDLGIPMSVHKPIIKRELDAFLLAAAEGGEGGAGGEGATAPASEPAHAAPAAAPAPKAKRARREAVAEASDGSDLEDGPAGGGLPGAAFSVELGLRRFAGVRAFKKAPLVDVREVYEAGGELKPGAKGLALNPGQWAVLAAALPALAAALAAADEAFSVDLGGSKRAGVSVFKGRATAGLREFYEKDGQWLPGKKGIALPAEQLERLVAAAPQLSAALATMPGMGLPAAVAPEATAAAEARAAAAAGGAPAAAPPPAAAVELAPMRRAEVTTFNGKRLVDVREFYGDAAGVPRHSRKGLQLSGEAFAALRAGAAALTAGLEAQDSSVKVELAPRRFASVSEFKGRWSVDLRELYMDKKTSELKPSPRGISLPAEQWAKLVAGLPALADALAA
jgi:hypothetical protein